MIEGAARLRARINGFGGRTVVVIGDLITDEYLFGKPARISREAPVLILRFAEREVRLGGGANAAHNVYALGARVIPIGVIGRDTAGEELLALFRAAGIPTDGVVTEVGRVTPVKTRIMAGGYQATRQQVVRLDREPRGDLQPMTEDALLSRLTALASRTDAILVSDYGYGTITPRVFERIRAIARRCNAIVSVDSRYELPRFTGVTAATPNEAELAQLTGMAVDDERALEKAGRQLLERLDVGMLLVTRGSQGMALLERDGGTTFIPIHGTDEIADVTGAGDTVISTFTLTLACGATPTEAALLANVAGGIVVMKRGTATVSRAELLQALAGSGES
ncbi:MAG: bifunctional hydroxymethylpyrimidine kinase/phosphomethylpyrimidine kinase [Candidatus Rokubacteria bacterium]|nr:bifunctional hydroxymethylpyrimidine kinase/phosphomethylpyrimidine kinase [Candidatus Rokubacteria bacterium]